MAILAYDDMMLREPALLTPRELPIGLCKLNTSHPAASRMLFGVTGRIGQPDIVKSAAFAGEGSNCGRYAPNDLQKIAIPNFDTLGVGDSAMFLYGRRLVAAMSNAGMAFGYNDAATDRCLAHLPFSDGTVYWDFGNATAGSGRVSVGGLGFPVGVNDWWLFVADTSIGREIWRNGVLVASNASATATRPNQGNPAYYNGTNDTNNGANHMMLGFYIFRGVTPDRRSLTAAPNELLQPA